MRFLGNFLTQVRIAELQSGSNDQHPIYFCRKYFFTRLRTKEMLDQCRNKNGSRGSQAPSNEVVVVVAIYLSSSLLELGFENPRLLEDALLQLLKAFPS